MNEKVVIVAIVSIAIAAVAVSLASSKFESYGRFGEIDMKLEAVNESHVVITFISEIKKENLDEFTVRAKIYDYQTGLLLDDVKKNFQSPESKYEALLTIPFEKTKDYGIELILMHEDKVLSLRHLQLKNLRSLVAENMQLEASMRGADFLLTGVKDGNVEFKARFYVESVKDYNVVTRIKVVQAESNVLVDEEWMNTTLRKGKTNIIEADFVVPDEYNYIVKLEIWREGKLVKSWKDVIKLAPTKIVPKDVEEEEVEFEVEKFVREEVPDYAERGAGMPGFEVALALIAIAGVAAWRRK
ncbi:MAG: hypothetical protein H0Z19_09665 [Archaeoglobus sp.]|uniref:DUF7490 domain-containing protein n=1 Tax=Archaeoglobus sp. TaxID=1872626 RepID=UPI001DFC7151|nr:PGF-CTERM sorting domain-containing protein [Archaeoglobus sp.]MBO8180722.1 hypothetical protein [Archaeoglobus sp.]